LFPAGLAFLGSAGARVPLPHHPDGHGARAREFTRMASARTAHGDVVVDGDHSATARLRDRSFPVCAAWATCFFGCGLTRKWLSPYLLGLQISPKVAFRRRCFIMWLG